MFLMSSELVDEPDQSPSNIDEFKGVKAIKKDHCVKLFFKVLFILITQLVLMAAFAITFVFVFGFKNE